MIIRWLEDAIFDLKALRLHIAQDKPSAAHRVAQRILTTVNYLSTHPAMGRLGRVSGTRELVIPTTPYIIPYRVKNKSIEILRVLHVAVEWPDTF
jgi:toxin ParE1/3/4